MQTLALILVVAGGVWLVCVATVMALRPALALQLVRKMTDKLNRSSWRLQFTEQGLRVLAGLALIVRAPESKLPLLFQIAGAVLVVTSLVIMAAPIRWHAAYGEMLVKQLTPLKLRILSPLPAAAGLGLVYAAV